MHTSRKRASKTYTKYKTDKDTTPLSKDNTRRICKSAECTQGEGGSRYKSQGILMSADQVLSDMRIHLEMHLVGVGGISNLSERGGSEASSFEKSFDRVSDTNDYDLEGSF